MTTEERIKKIQHLFIDTQQKASGLTDIGELSDVISSVEPNYTSLAVEAVSATIAEQEELNGVWWEWYKLYKGQCSNQILIGLGWAQAKLETYNFSFFSENSAETWWCLDGAGYYDVLFKRRLIIRNRSTPKTISKELHPPYFQGVGRGLWYLSKGDVQRLKDLLILFDKDLLPHIWRGIGVALTYVDNNERNAVQDLKKQSGKHLNSLTLGVWLAAHSLNKNNSASNRTLLEQGGFVSCNHGLLIEVEQADVFEEALTKVLGVISTAL